MQIIHAHLLAAQLRSLVAPSVQLKFDTAGTGTVSSQSVGILFVLVHAPP